MKAKSSVLARALWILMSCCAIAQPDVDFLPRRGYFGVGLEPSESGVRVFSVAPRSTAAEVGIRTGDIILSVDGRTSDSPESAMAAIGRHRSGEVVSIGVSRDGASRIVKAALKPFPSERMENATVHYSSVEVEPGVRLRTILSVPIDPRAQRYPAVLLIQGGGCGSVDTPIGDPVAQPGLMHAIGSQGFVTMRVEKSGVGDSQGQPCAMIGFKEEFTGYEAALKALRILPEVDPNRIYLLGISLGGVFAPLLAAETQVAGIVVYGTLASSPPRYPGRSERFFDEFSRVDVPSAWRKVNTKVLILHGEYDVDPAVNRFAHETVAHFVNKANPGAAEFHELGGLDHCWSRHESLEASKDRCGQGEQTTELADMILAFLRSRSK